MHAGTAHMHVVAPSAMRQDTAAQRKRPKYTRSKTGCLTCRGKKIKARPLPRLARSSQLTLPQCDETKPTCVRCSHGQREVSPAANVASRRVAARRR